MQAWWVTEVYTVHAPVSRYKIINEILPWAYMESRFRGSEGIISGLFDDFDYVLSQEIAVTSGSSLLWRFTEWRTSVSLPSNGSRTRNYVWIPEKMKYFKVYREGKELEEGRKGYNSFDGFVTCLLARKGFGDGPESIGKNCTKGGTLWLRR